MWDEVRALREPFIWALPAYAIAIALELVHSTLLRKDGRYPLRETFANLGISAGNTTAAILWTPLIFALNCWAYALTPLRVPGGTWWSWIALFVLADLAYYVSHRCGHHVRLFWATHVVHHTAERMNFTVGLRNPWTSGLHDWIFWLPLPLVGFDPVMLVKVQCVGLIYQFFLHTESIKHLGPLEWIFNTPAHHRVHHGLNPEYIDRNLGGVLIVWDRLFGTFAAERERVPIIYGATTPVRSHNPVVIAFSGWVALLRDLRRSPAIGAALGCLFGKVR